MSRLFPLLGKGGVARSAGVVCSWRVYRIVGLKTLLITDFFTCEHVFMNPEKPVLPTEPTEADLDQERRDALKRLGRYAAYTPPVVLTLLASRKVAASIVDPGPD